MTQDKKIMQDEHEREPIFGGVADNWSGVRPMTHGSEHLHERMDYRVNCVAQLAELK